MGSAAVSRMKEQQRRHRNPRKTTSWTRGRGDTGTLERPPAGPAVEETKEPQKDHQLDQQQGKHRNLRKTTSWTSSSGDTGTPERRPARLQRPGLP